MIGLFNINITYFMPLDFQAGPDPFTASRLGVAVEIILPLTGRPGSALWHIFFYGANYSGPDKEQEIQMLKYQADLFKENPERIKKRMEERESN